MVPVTAAINWRDFPPLLRCHRWTRERIADWVETIERAQEVPVAEPAQVTLSGRTRGLVVQTRSRADTNVPTGERNVVVRRAKNWSEGVSRLGASDAPPALPAELPASMQLSSVLSLAPPPVSAPLPTNVQLVNALQAAPPPLAEAVQPEPAKLPLSVQSFSALQAAPPPWIAELPRSVQCLSVPE